MCEVKFLREIAEVVYLELVTRFPERKFFKDFRETVMFAFYIIHWESWSLSFTAQGAVIENYHSVQTLIPYENPRFFERILELSWLKETYSIGAYDGFEGRG